GAALGKAPPYRRARLGLGYVPQGRETFPLLTVKENLQTGFAPLKARARTAPETVFELFPVLAPPLSGRGGGRSGGRRQQLAIGRARVTRLCGLVLGEPTAGIPPSVIKDVGGALQFLGGEMELSILLVEQYLHVGRTLADSIYIMDRGE